MQNKYNTPKIYIEINIFHVKYINSFHNHRNGTNIS